MGKARIDKYGRTREQKLVQENRTLKRLVNSLRKQLARLDVDRIDIAKEVIMEQYQQEKAQEGKEILENLKKVWACSECEDGHLEIFIYNKLGDTYYYRVCSNAPKCHNRTLPKLYTPNVKGIMRKTYEET